MLLYLCVVIVCLLYVVWHCLLDRGGIFVVDCCCSLLTMVVFGVVIVCRVLFDVVVVRCPLLFGVACLRSSCVFVVCYLLNVGIVCCWRLLLCCKYVIVVVWCSLFLLSVVVVD